MLGRAGARAGWRGGHGVAEGRARGVPARADRTAAEHTPRPWSAAASDLHERVCARQRAVAGAGCGASGSAARTARPTRRREEVPTRKMASAHTPSRHATAPFFPAAPATRWRPVAAVAAATAATTTAVELAAGRGIGGGRLARCHQTADSLCAAGLPISGKGRTYGTALSTVVRARALRGGGRRGGAPVGGAPEQERPASGSWRKLVSSPRGAGDEPR